MSPESERVAAGLKSKKGQHGISQVQPIMRYM